MIGKNTDIKHFEYINSKGYSLIFPFRIGDIVKVADWGYSYSSYSEAFFYFTNKHNTPYYSMYDKIPERENVNEFKIINIAEHSIHPKYIVAYIKDRMGHDQVIDLEGLELVKQMPLRIGEKTVINLKKINPIKI